MIHRILKPLLKNSILLLGARGTGKSTLIRQWFENRQKTLWINLLQPEQEEEYGRNPGLLRETALAQKSKIVIIDEIQKNPKLLDIVHELIESHGLQFVITGSSARKLKRGAANLLAGRAFSYRLDPLSHLEFKKSKQTFDLQSALEFGLLPKIYFPNPHSPRERWNNSQKTTFLQTYARTYLKEEIQLEQIVRQISPFRNFLEVAAQMNGKIIELANISRDVGIDDKTAAEYFQILEDTLVGHLLYPYHRSIRKRQGQRPKFYFFDPGVKRALDRTLTVPLVPRTSAFGEAFEHFVILEFFKIAQVINPDIRFSFFRTTDGSSEIDLIVERPGRPVVLVEIKSSSKIEDRTITKLKLFEKDFSDPEIFILCLNSKPRIKDGVKILPWQKGLEEILGKVEI